MRIGSSFVFYLGFVKFYRHHTLENLMSITVDPNLRGNLQGRYFRLCLNKRIIYK